MKYVSFSEKKPIWYIRYALLHPSDAFQEMKFNKKQSPLLVCGIVFLWLLTELASVLFMDYDFDPEVGTQSLFNVVVVTALTFIIAIISNWCFCTLLDGKGKLIDIAMVGASALVPYIVVKLIEIVLSHFVTTSLSSFFYYAVTLAVIWGFFIVFAGLQNIHEYSALMTIVSLLLTVLGIMIVIFLLLVVIQLYQQIVVFISTIALEIKYR